MCSDCTSNNVGSTNGKAQIQDPLERVAPSVLLSPCYLQSYQWRGGKAGLTVDLGPMKSQFRYLNRLQGSYNEALPAWGFHSCEKVEHYRVKRVQCKKGQVPQGVSELARSGQVQTRSGVLDQSNLSSSAAPVCWGNANLVQLWYLIHPPNSSPLLHKWVSEDFLYFF